MLTVDPSSPVGFEVVIPWIKPVGPVHPINTNTNTLQKEVPFIIVMKRGTWSAALFSYATSL